MFKNESSDTKNLEASSSGLRPVVNNSPFVDDITDDILIPDNFIVVSFTYNKGTKKTQKYFVSQIKRLLKNKTYEVNCLRSFKESKDTFVFPPVPDINVIDFDQIQKALTQPIICRGRHSFN